MTKQDKAEDVLLSLSIDARQCPECDTEALVPTENYTNKYGDWTTWVCQSCLRGRTTNTDHEIAIPALARYYLRSWVSTFTV